MWLCAFLRYVLEECESASLPYLLSKGEMTRKKVDERSRESFGIAGS